MLLLLLVGPVSLSLACFILFRSVIPFSRFVLFVDIFRLFFFFSFSSFLHFIFRCYLKCCAAISVWFYRLNFCMNASFTHIFDCRSQQYPNTTTITVSINYRTTYNVRTWTYVQNVLCNWTKPRTTEPNPARSLTQRKYSIQMIIYVLWHTELERILKNYWDSAAFLRPTFFSIIFWIQKGDIFELNWFSS